MWKMKKQIKIYEEELEKWSIFLFFSILFFLILYLFYDYLFLRNLYLFKDVANDSLNIFYPRWMQSVDYLSKYGIPMWSCKSGMGENIFPGSLNSPFSLLLYLFGDSLAYGIIYIEVLKVLLLWIISFCYFRTISLSKYVSGIGGLALAFSGYMMAGSSGWYGHSSLILYGVFLFLAFEQLYLKKRWYYFPLAIVLISSASLFYVYIFTLFLIVYILLRFISDHGFKVKRLFLLFLNMGFLGILGLSINAIFLIPSFMNMINSPRVGGDSGHFNKLMQTSVFSFASGIEYVSIILKLFATNILGSGEIFVQTINNQKVMVQAYHGWGNYFESPLFYCTLPVLLLLPQVFIFLSKRQKVLYATLLSLLGIILLFPFFRYALYMFAGNYFKGGLNFFIPFIFVFCAMQALNYIESNKRLNAKLLIVTLMILLTLLYLPYLFGYGTLIVLQLQLFSSIFLILYAFLLLRIPFLKSQLIWKFLFMIALIIEVGYLTDLTLNNRVALSVKEFKSKEGYNDYTADALEFIKKRDDGFYRIQKEYDSTPAIYESLNDAMVQDFYGTSSYSSFNQSYYIKFLAAVDIIDASNESHTRWAPGLVRNPLLQSFASVKYGLSKTVQIYFPKFGYKLINKIGDVYIYENLQFIPLGFTIEKYMLESEFFKLNTLQKGGAILQAIIVDDKLEKNYKEFPFIIAKEIPLIYNLSLYIDDVKVLRKDTLRIQQFSPNKISGKITLNKNKMMLFTIPYDRGWSVTVDNKKRTLELVDFGFMGVMIPKGNHIVELSFHPPNLILGMVISLIGFFIYIFMLVYFYRRERGISKKLQNPTNNS